jgi:uncharacterized protein YyaL (SSP411 family)
MAHEKFEVYAIAGLVNDLFINIKVGREEHSDIDHIYMNSLHMWVSKAAPTEPLNSLSLIFPVLVECL